MNRCKGRVRAAGAMRLLNRSLQIVIMVVIQTAHGDALAVAPQLPFQQTAVLAAVVSLDRETSCRAHSLLSTLVRKR